MRNWSMLWLLWSGGDKAAKADVGESGSTLKALQKKILRTHPGSEMKVERIDYSKAKAYTDSPTYHRLEDYYSLPEGAYYVTRGGAIDKNYVKVILFTPAKVEEHIYETATVRFRDEDDISTLDTISIDRPIDGCCFGTETLSYILMEKFWYNTPFEQIVRKLKMNLRNAGNIGSEDSAADNAFMYSVIESCKHNDIDPGKYISFLLGKLKTAGDGDDLTGLLPCYCGL